MPPVPSGDQSSQSQLTEQLGDVEEGLTPQEVPPVAARVARETLLAPVLLLLRLHKVSRDVVILRDHGGAWGTGSSTQGQEVVLRSTTQGQEVVLRDRR